MNPMLKFYGQYCSCLAALSLIFFGILIIIVGKRNPYLVRGATEEEISSKIKALVIAIIVNAVCFVLCAACVFFGVMQERK